MKTDISLIGRLSKKYILPLFSQDNFVLTGFTHATNNNNNRTNCMNNLTIDPKERMDFIRKKLPKKSNYSSKGLRILMILGLLLFSISLFAQNVGDYGAIGNGDWDDQSNWGVWDGSSFVNNGTYPGAGGIASYDVYINNNFTIIIDGEVPGTFQTLIIGEGTLGTLQIIGNSEFHFAMLLIESNGVIDWGGNTNYSLTLPEDVVIIIKEGGILDEEGSCSASRSIVIGNNTYSVCNNNAGNDELSFEELINNGGSVFLNPTSNSPICEGAILDLETNLEPIGSGDPNDYAVSWSGTGPNGYTYSSTVEDPSISGLEDGDYTFEVTVTYFGTITKTESLDVVVISSPTAEAGVTAELTCVITTITLDGSGTTPGLDYLWTGPGTITAETTLSPTIDTPGTYTLTVTNSSTGCTATDTVVVTFLNDTTDPVADVASLPALTAQCEIASLTAPTAIDNCDGALTATTGVSLPITSSTTITWTYTDASGNTATQTQAVVINDT
ncbi:hypothetical protein AABB81_11945, partial [Lutimonas vermicola]